MGKTDYNNEETRVKLSDSVTVLVLSYNSQKTVIETLDSIKNQTFQRLHLVIADDASSDDTVSLCKQWVTTNSTRFLSCRILESDKNRGTSANFNRGESVCSTKWVKPIAADDILLPDCIQINLDYIHQQPDIVLLFSKQKAFNNKGFLPVKEYNTLFFEQKPEEQSKSLVYDSTILDAPTLFYNLEVTRKAGLFCDERIPLIEDLPKWINATKLNLSFGFLPEITVLYRLRKINQYSPKEKSPRFYQSERLLYFYYLYDERIKHNKDGEIQSLVDSERKYFNSYFRYRNFFLFRVFRSIVAFLKVRK